MKLRNPCKRCIVQASCGQLCNDKIEYGSSLTHIEWISLTIMLCVGALTGGLIIPTVFGFLDISNVILAFIAMLAYSLLLGWIILKMGKYISKEKSDYLKQKFDQMHRDMENTCPTFPRGRKIP